MVLSKLIKEYKEMGLEDVPVKEVLEDLQKLEDIYKPKDVPQFVVDWYEKYKDNLEYNIWAWMRCLERGEGVNKQFHLWLNDCNNKPVETLVKMKLFGYKVKKVKRYIVKIKRVNSDKCYLNCVGNEDNWIISDKAEYKYIRVKHTKEELCQAGFGWVFNCPGIEIEEVEE